MVWKAGADQQKDIEMVEGILTAKMYMEIISDHQTSLDSKEAHG